MQMFRQNGEWAHLDTATNAEQTRCERSAAFTPLQLANVARLPMNSNIQPNHTLKRRERRVPRCSWECQDAPMGNAQSSQNQSPMPVLLLWTAAFFPKERGNCFEQPQPLNAALTALRSLATIPLPG